MLEPADAEAPATLRCKLCSHEAVWPFQLDHHIERNHKIVAAIQESLHPTEALELHLCIHCSFTSNFRLPLYEHYKQHGPVGGSDGDDIETCQRACQSDQEFQKYTCDNCMHEEYSSLSFIKHPDSCVKIVPKTLTVYVGVPASFQCAQCSYKSKSESQLEKHTLKHVTGDSIKWFKCTKCAYKAKRSGNLKVHMLTHAEDYKILDKINRFDCTKCSFRAKHRYILKRHEVTHLSADEIDWFYCTECSLRFKFQNILKKHMVTHADDVDWFCCPKCPYRTKWKANVKQHVMRMHATVEEISWFDCDKCSYRAKENVALKKHSSVHVRAEEATWFKCDHCAYVSKINGNVRRHMRNRACDYVSRRGKKASDSISVRNVAS